jgi:hypothetical protein
MLIDPERSSDPGHISAANVSAWVALGLIIFVVVLAGVFLDKIARWYFGDGVCR